MQSAAQNPPLFLLHTATHFEAAPLVALFKLSKKVDWAPFDLYFKGNIYLAVSSIGKIKTAAAIAAAITYINSNHTRQTNIYLVNIGIAGANTEIPVGTLGHAIRVDNVNTQQSYFPDHLIAAPGAAWTIKTYDTPQSELNNDYINSCSNTIVDMEAAAVFETGRIYTSTSTIQSLKIVSDHLQPFTLNKSKIEQLIQGHVVTIADYINRLTEIISCIDPIFRKDELNYIDTLLGQLKFTRSQSIELINRIKHYKLSKGAMPDLSEFIALVPQSKQDRSNIYHTIMRQLV